MVGNTSSSWEQPHGTHPYLCSMSTHPAGSPRFGSGPGHSPGVPTDNRARDRIPVRDTYWTLAPMAADSWRRAAAATPGATNSGRDRRAGGVAAAAHGGHPGDDRDVGRSD